MAILRKDIISDMNLLSRLRRGASSFSGRQSGLGATFARNMVSSWGGNPYQKRIKSVQRRLDSNLSIYRALQSMQNPRKKRMYRCDDLTAEQAFHLFKLGHTYLDRDHDGIPCER